MYKHMRSLQSDIRSNTHIVHWQPHVYSTRVHAFKLLKYTVLLNGRFYCRLLLQLTEHLTAFTNTFETLQNRSFIIFSLISHT